MSQGIVALSRHSQRAAACLNRKCGAPAPTIGKTSHGIRLLKESRRHIKKTRDATFITNDSQGRTVNRCESIAWNGGCTDTNEFNYLVVKTMRGLGVDLFRKSGQGLTRSNGLQFGAHVWTRCDD